MHFYKKNITAFAVLIFLLLSSFRSANGQINPARLDSLYNAFVQLKSEKKLDLNIPHDHLETEPVKCGLPLFSIIQSNFHNFSPEQQSVLKNLFQRPDTQTSLVSPSGNFRIHYDTTGTETPIYDSLLSAFENAFQVALAADSSFNFEVNFLGYPPPVDDGEGGDNLYDIYISDRKNGDYGSTSYFTGGATSPTYIIIDNDFGINYATHGIDAARVTVAHELHHGIQIGNYSLPAGNRVGDTFFYEITSTAMEEFVFDDVNDYYAYMPHYFNNTSKSFSRFGVGNDGYDHAIWNIFMVDRFGHDIIKRQWELMKTMRALHAINASINEYGSSFGKEFNEFGIWTYYTNNRAISGKYFEEAAFYPLVKPVGNPVEFSPAAETISGNNIKPLSNTFYKFLNKNIIPNDTLDIFISNSDFAQATVNNTVSSSFVYILYDFNAPESRQLTLNYFAKLNVEKPSFWSTAEFLNEELVGGEIFITEADFPFPSPFRYGKDVSIFIPVSNPQTNFADFNIYTSGMDLVYSTNVVLQREFGKAGIKWNALNNNNSKLSSGVYIYVVKSGDDTSVGKLVIFSE